MLFQIARYLILPVSPPGSTIETGDNFYRMTTSQTPQQTRIQTRNLVQAAAQACLDKKGEDTRILELDPIDSGLSDFFLVTSASNDRQAIAISDEIEHRLKKEFGVFPNSVEGRRKDPCRPRQIQQAHSGQIRHKTRHRTQIKEAARQSHSCKEGPTSGS